MDSLPFARKAAKSAAMPVGFDPATLIALIQTIVATLQACRTKEAKRAFASPESVRETAGEWVRSRRVCPTAVRLALRKEGFRIVQEQEELWHATLHAAATEQPRAMAFMVMPTEE